MYLNDAVKFFETMVKNHIKDKKIQKVIPVLVGPPGIGKTAMLHQMADKNNWAMIPIHMAQIPMEMLSGIPLPKYDEGSVKWTEPEFIHNANKLAENHEAVILFFDDIHTAREDKQELFFELATERKLHGFKLKDNVFIVAAGNFKIQHGGKKFLTPILSRFAWWKVELNPEAWLQWAIEKGIHPLIVQYFGVNKNKLHTYLLMEPEHLNVSFTGFPTPRTWEYLSEQLYAFEQMINRKIIDVTNNLFSHEEQILRDIIIGTIGEKAGKDFYETIKITLSLDIDRMFETDFKAFLQLNDPVKKYNAIFSIIGKLADTYYIDTVNGNIEIKVKPQMKKYDKIEKWFKVLSDIQRATNNKLFSVIAYMASSIHKVEYKINNNVTHVNFTTLVGIMKENGYFKDEQVIEYLKTFNEINMMFT